MLGSYLAYVFVRTETLPTVIINHGFLNFMGRPNFGDLMSDDYYTNQQRQSINILIPRNSEILLLWVQRLRHSMHPRLVIKHFYILYLRYHSFAEEILIILLIIKTYEKYL